MEQLLIAAVVPSVVAVVLAVILVVVIVLWRRGGSAARRELAAARAAAEVPDPLLAELQGRDRIAHDALVGTAASLTAIIDRADSVTLTATQDAAAAARIAAGVGEQLRVVRDDVRRVADLVAPELADADAIAAATPSELALPPLVPTSGSVPTSMTQLAVRARDAGLAVRVETVGEPFAVPAPFAAAVMRVVELALENAAVHAGRGATALVVATWTDDALRVAVEDDGVRAAARRDGRDPDAPVPPDADARLAAMTGADGPVIAEMRAATAAYDGVFGATAVPGIGFTVTATFPGVRRAPIDDDAAHGAG